MLCVSQSHVCSVLFPTVANDGSHYQWLFDTHHLCVIYLNVMYMQLKIFLSTVRPSCSFLLTVASNVMACWPACMHAGGK